MTKEQRDKDILRARQNVERTREYLSDTLLTPTHLKDGIRNHITIHVDNLVQYEVELALLLKLQDTESKIFKACQYAENIACSEGVMEEKERHIPWSKAPDPR